ncbi:hypothetical protein ACFL4T_00555 [candidate division KSB1 bacterium]
MKFRLVILMTGLGLVILFCILKKFVIEIFCLGKPSGILSYTVYFYFNCKYIVCLNIERFGKPVLVSLHVPSGVIWNLLEKNNVPALTGSCQRWKWIPVFKGMTFFVGFLPNHMTHLWIFLFIKETIVNVINKININHQISMVYNEG